MLTGDSAVASAVPTVADVDRIAAMENRVIRNLEITQCYSELSAALRARIGGVADWCTYATWASRQAGATIRGEDLLERFERELGRNARLLEPILSINRKLLQKGLLQPDTTLGRLVARIHTPFDAFERASDAVAKGNVKVFEEIGREVARFLASVPAESPADSPELADFLAGLRQGPPPEGQDNLVQAFTYYQMQRHEPDPGTRAAQLLLANLLIGLHEQTRLQPQIAAAVDSPLVTAEDLSVRMAVDAVPGGRLPFIREPLRALFGWLAGRMQRDARRMTRTVVTECMMVLRLPDRVLDLGSNLVAPIPSDLAAATYEPLGAFVAEYDPCKGGPDGCGADDWSDLRQRMHYILHLFRAFGRDLSLQKAPFSPAAVRRFREGVVPEGDL